MIVLIIPNADGPGFPLVYGPFNDHEAARDYADSLGMASGFLTSEVTSPVHGEKAGTGVIGLGEPE